MNRDQLVVGVSLIHIMEKQDGFVDANRGLNYISPEAVTIGSSELCKVVMSYLPASGERATKTQMKMPDNLLCWKGTHQCVSCVLSHKCATVG